MSAEADNLGTTRVREGFAFDEAALDRWMREHVADYEGPLAVSQFRGGQSNPTYRLDTPRKAYVLRRKPPGQLLHGAHAVEREAKIQIALIKAGFPVAHVYGLCTDESVIGTWFYVMDMIEGRIFWDASISGIPNEERAAIFDAMNGAIAGLHLVDYAAVGLADYGRSSQYFQRQIARWTKQYLAAEEAGRDPYLDRMIAWLPDNIAAHEEETRLIHGDFRIDNMIFHPTEPRVLAVLDWELSTLGHPLADFAYHAMMYRMPPHIVAGLKGADITALGIPAEEEYVARYCQRTGRDSIVGYDFAIAFNFFRLAAIFHGIKARVLRGTAASAQAQERVKVLPELTALAWEQAVRAGAR